MELVQTCLRRGADTFLIKPLNLGQAMHLWQFMRRVPPGLRAHQAKRDPFPASTLTAAMRRSCGGRGGLSLAEHRSVSDPIPGGAETAATADSESSRASTSRRGGMLRRTASWMATKAVPASSSDRHLRDDVEISCGTRDVPSWIDSCIQWRGAGTELLWTCGVLAPDRIRRVGTS